MSNLPSVCWETAESCWEHICKWQQHLWKCLCIGGIHWNLYGTTDTGIHYSSRFLSLMNPVYCSMRQIMNTTKTSENISHPFGDECKLNGSSRKLDSQDYIPSIYEIPSIWLFSLRILHLILYSSCEVNFCQHGTKIFVNTFQNFVQSLPAFLVALSLESCPEK